MNSKLTAFEIMTMAETIEYDSIDFYRKAARRFADEGRRNIFFLLADWERKHREVFSAMKKELAQALHESPVFDISTVISPNPQRLVGLAALAPGSLSNTELTGQESKKDMLELAITRERNIVSFYYNLIGVMDDFVGNSRIHDIIREERSHISVLRRAIEKCSGRQSIVSTRGGRDKKHRQEIKD